jgi:hypothetical protein
MEKIMRWMFPLLIAVFTACSYSYNPYNLPVIVQKVDVASFSEVIIPYAVELSHTSRLRFEDSKVYYDDFVERFRVIWSTQQILELCETRDLLVTVVEGLLERLNANGQVISSFDHYPITADDLEIYFFFESNYIEYDDPTYIAFASLHDGTVRYIDGNIKNPRTDFWDTRVETYEEAYRFSTLMRASEKAYKEAHAKPKRNSSVFSNYEPLR